LSTFTNPIYIIQGPLRKVEPYDFTFVTFAKGRWLHSSLYDVFCKEFRDRSHAYYASFSVLQQKNLKKKTGKSDSRTTYSSQSSTLF
jgi:hypothetical protein